MINLKIIFYLTIIYTTTSLAQVENISFSKEMNESSVIKTIKSDAFTFFNVGVNFFKSPFYYSEKDLYLTGVILGLTAISFPLDEPIRNRTLRFQSKSLDNISFVTEKFGNPRIGFAMSGILYGGGLLIANDYIRETGQMLTEALIFNGLVTTGAKLMFNRVRPFTNESSYKMEIFEFESEFKETSLPSGHTSTAFTVATVLSERINNKYVSVALYSMASLTAFQRVYADRHWFSDTILGAALGTMIGLKIVNLHEKSTSLSNTFQYSIYPKLNAGSYGMGLMFQF